MTIFFNDTFLKEDYLEYDDDVFDHSLRKFIEFSKVISIKKQEYDTRIYFKADEKIKSILTDDLDKDEYRLFLRTLEKLNLKYWNNSSCQKNTSNYFFYDTSVFPPESVHINNTSLAEASELKKTRQLTILALNLPDLTFSQIHQIHINIIAIQDNTDVEKISIDCADCESSLGFWIDKILSEEYLYKNEDFTRPPIDKETCLINQFKFEKVTGLIVQGRHVYKDKSDNYWYVDNLHRGDAAHLEVFRSTGEHLGESSLDGEIDYAKADASKTIDLS